MRNKLSQLINHSRPLIPEVWDKREVRPILLCRVISKKRYGSNSITSLVWRGRLSNPRPPALGANALTWATAAVLNLVIMHSCSNVCICRQLITRHIDLLNNLKIDLFEEVLTTTTVYILWNLCESMPWLPFVICPRC